MKKLKTMINGEAFRLILCSLMAFLAVYCTFPSVQILATLPLLSLCGLLLPFLYRRTALLIPITALTAILLSLALTDGARNHLFYTFVPTALFSAALYISPLLKHKHAGRKMLGIVLCLLLFGAHFLLFGNPVSLKAATKTAQDLYQTRYPSESFAVEKEYYDPLTASYKAEFLLSDREKFTAAAGEDGYLLLMQTRAAALQKSTLLALLHEKFPADGPFLITVKVGEVPVQEISEYKLGAMPDEWLMQNDVVLEFDSSVAVGSMQAKASFALTVRNYVTALKDAAFPYRSLTVRAGEQDVPHYELVATPETSLDELVAPKVKELQR